MLLAHLFRSLGWRSDRKRLTPTHRPRRSFAPELTVLEDRTVLSTFTVMNLNDSGPGSLRAGVASGADTIKFAHGLHGTITLASEIAISASVTINGPGANQITVSGHHTTRVFDISGGNVAIADLTISGGLATSSSPNGSNGGGIYHGGGTLTLSRDVLAGNEADGTAAGDFGYGGALLNAPGATLSIDSSTFTGNVATGDGKGRGGALFNYGTATVAGSDFTDNQALGGTNGANITSSGSGGAIANLGSVAVSPTSPITAASLTVSDSTFTENLAQGSAGIAGGGGAIWNRYANAPGDNAVAITDSVVVTDSTFTGNRAVGGAGSAGAGGWGLGGAFVVQSNGATPALGDNAVLATLSVSGSTFTDNEAVGGGGGGRGVGAGIWTNGDLASTTVTASKFAGNQAIGASGGSGSGIFASDGMAIGGGIGTGFGGSLSVSDSLFNGNRALGGSGGDAWGGGIANFASMFDSASVSATISKSVFVNNQAVGGAGGSGLGGALFNGGTAVFGTEAPPFTLTMTVSDSVLVHNQAIGGDAIVGNGGDGEGGGLFNGLGTPTATLSDTVITANQALGGEAGTGGADGQGIGGGIYNTGTVFVHKVVIEGNKASTSNDNVFGPLIPF
jgi:hypothetical protein